jgi:hypothetical protein
LRDEVEQVAADAVLENEPNVVLRLVPIVKLEHVTTVELVEKLDFVQDLCRQAHRFNRTPPLQLAPSLTFSMRVLAVDFTATYSMLRLRRALYTNECVPRPISS